MSNKLYKLYRITYDQYISIDLLSIINEDNSTTSIDREIYAINNQRSKLFQIIMSNITMEVEDVHDGEIENTKQWANMCKVISNKGTIIVPIFNICSIYISENLYIEKEDNQGIFEIYNEFPK